MSRDSPVISAGFSMPISSISVGMISARRPPSRRVYFGSAVYKDKRNRIGRMCGKRCASLIIDHLLCISVVCADEELSRRSLSLLLLPCRHSSSTASIALIAAGITPVWPTISGFAKFVMITSYFPEVIAADYFIANLINAHFRLQVIGRYLRGFYKNTVFTLVRLLYTAVEEEGNMCVFLRLSDSCLCHAMRCQDTRRRYW